VKEKKQNISIRELFRERLENAEVIPDASVKSELIRKVEKMEFLRFNPSRFNIYYIGGVLITGIAAVLLLSSGPSKSNLNQPSQKPSETEQIVDTSKLFIPVEKTVIKKSESPKVVPLKKNLEKPDTVSNVKSPRQTVNEPFQADGNKINSTNVAESIPGKGLFPAGDSEKKKLQGRLGHSENLINASVMEGCSPLKVRFTSNVGSSDSCRWSFGDGGISCENNPEWIYDVEGEFKVELNLFSPDGSQITSSTIIKVHPKPLARFEISLAETGQSDNLIRFSNYSSNAVRFKWDFGDGTSSDSFEPKYNNEKSGNYNVMLVAFSEYGCSDSLIIPNAFTGRMYFISFPNAFIPNQGGPTGGYYSPKSDEAANVFHPVFSGVSDYQLRIFSKLGILIFESNDIHVGWDGYLKGQLCEQGVYIWKVRGSYLNGEPFIKMGDVTLLKN
jgi:PKD repeat protein